MEEVIEENKVILEVSVDRLNEKWVFIAEQILNILHNTLEEKKNFWGKKSFTAPEISFEIANIDWIIRFFFIIKRELKELLENQIYAHYPNVEIREVPDHIKKDFKWFIWQLSLKTPYFNPIKIYSDFTEKTERGNIDPFSSLTAALTKNIKWWVRLIQVNFSPIPDRIWKNEQVIDILSSKKPKFIKNILLSKNWKIFKKIFSPFSIFIQWIKILIHPSKAAIKTEKKEPNKILERKLTWFGYTTSINIAIEWINELVSKVEIKDIISAFSIFSIAGQNGFKLDKIRQNDDNYLQSRINEKNIILNNSELAWLVHLPTIYVQTPGINWVLSKTLEPPNNIPILWTKDTIVPIWETNFRWSKVNFWIAQDDRRRHMYIIWKTWMWKSVLLENLIYDDIVKWRWVALIDPHWDLAETIISNIPKSRTNDVIYFDPADFNNPIAFNMFEMTSKELRSNISSWLVSVFKRIFGTSWWPRLEYILRNTIITLLELPDSTLMSIPLMLTNKSYRLKIVGKITDPIMIKFWAQEFESLDPKQMTEAISPILNKVGQFLSSPTLRNILCQPKNPFGFRWIMDNKKIFIANLSKWKIWEDSMELLGSLMITKFQVEAMRRADMEESKRKDFYLYVDEFQNFANDSFATILSEARKYKLNLTIANQYISQMTDVIKWAVFWNIGSMVSFQVWPEDAPKLVEAFGKDIVTENDLQNIRKYNIYMRLLIDWMPSRVFSAATFPPVKTRSDGSEQSMENIKKVSREKYSKPVDFVEKKIFDLSNQILEEEKRFKKEQAEFKEKMKEEKKKKSEIKI